MYRHGHANGLQRYRCRDCGHTCNALTNTPLARLRYKPRWLDYLSDMLDSSAVCRSAADLGIASATSFPHQPTEERSLAGILESRVIDPSLSVDKETEFFNSIDRLRTDLDGPCPTLDSIGRRNKLAESFSGYLIFPVQRPVLFRPRFQMLHGDIYRMAAEASVS